MFTLFSVLAINCGGNFQNTSKKYLDRIYIQSKLHLKRPSQNNNDKTNQTSSSILETIAKVKLSSLYSFTEIAHFTVVCLIAWPWMGSEAGGEFVLIQSCLFLICRSCCSYAS